MAGMADMGGMVETTTEPTAGRLRDATSADRQATNTEMIVVAVVSDRLHCT